MLKLLENGTDKSQQVVLKNEQKGAEPGKNISLGKDLYDVMIIHNSCQVSCFRGLMQIGRKSVMSWQRVTRRATFCAKAVLQAPNSLLMSALSKWFRGIFFKFDCRCRLGTDRLANQLTFLGSTKNFINTHWLQRRE